jgi:hypothetical protein
MKRIVIKISEEDAQKSAADARAIGMQVCAYRSEIFMNAMRLAISGKKRK